MRLTRLTATLCLLQQFEKNIGDHRSVFYRTRSIAAGAVSDSYTHFSDPVSTMTQYRVTFFYQPKPLIGAQFDLSADTRGEALRSVEAMIMEKSPQVPAHWYKWVVTEA